MASKQSLLQPSHLLKEPQPESHGLNEGISPLRAAS